MKKRKQKQSEYDSLYSDIPKDFNERLLYMYDKYRISDKKAEQIIQKRNQMVESLNYNDLVIVLYEIVEGSPRPRFRLVNRHNLINEAMSNNQFVHVYSINAKDDSLYMKRLVDQDLINISELIYTPCIIEYNTYHKTPSQFNIDDTFLAEIGLIRPISKPDWDNIGKKYSDMFNHNIWIDDTLVISGTVNKYYSILPRIEIKLRFLNMLYNKYQYKSMSNKTTQQVLYFKGDK